VVKSTKKCSNFAESTLLLIGVVEAILVENTHRTLEVNTLIAFFFGHILYLVCLRLDNAYQDGRAKTYFFHVFKDQ
jgi:uncharacterized membrane protein YhhN